MRSEGHGLQEFATCTSWQDGSGSERWHLMKMTLILTKEKGTEMKSGQNEKMWNFNLNFLKKLNPENFFK